MAFAQIYLTQLRKFCDEEEHAVKAEKLKSNGKIYGEPNSYKMVSQSQIESCLERVQESVWNTFHEYTNSSYEKNFKYKRVSNYAYAGFETIIS